MSNQTGAPAVSPATSRSVAAFERARRFMPGGVSSPVRAFKSLGGSPRFIARAKGPYMWDEDGNRLVDLIGSWGPMIAGHAHPAVTAALREAIERGTSFGAPSTLESDLAEEILQAMPNLEMLRFVSSGTEATMSAIRLARAATGREKLVKFIGCYHGHADPLLVAAGSGAATLGTPSSPGVPAAVVAGTLLAEFNDLEAVEAIAKRDGDNLAAILVEPIAGNMGFVRPAPGFLEGLRRVCDATGALLVFDEVMTGFRVALGGVSALSGVRPDIVCLGKVIGGGMPVGAYGASAEIMRRVSPDGPVYQAGTLSGNPVAMTAGIATMTLVKEPGFFEKLDARSRRLAQGLLGAAMERGIPMQVDSEGGMLGFFFADKPIRSFADAKMGDHARFAKFFHAMLDRGVYLAPSSYEALFISSEHDDDVIEEILSAARASLDEIAAAADGASR